MFALLPGTTANPSTALVEEKCTHAVHILLEMHSAPRHAEGTTRILLSLGGWGWKIREMQARFSSARIKERGLTPLNRLTQVVS